MRVATELVHLHETVRTLCNKGWHVFPLVTGRKTPATKNGHKNATNNVDAALRLFDVGTLNIGVAAGQSHLVVLDVDGKPGHDWLADAKATYGIPKTFNVETRARGLHCYFKAPGGIEIKCSAGRIAPGIDIRASGGYVVGPSSWVDADKKGPAGLYRVIDDSPVAPLPQWLLTKLIAIQQRPVSPPSSSQKTRPIRKAETPRAVATLKDLLNHIDADCHHDVYRSVVWGVISTGWQCAEQLALDWSLTAEHRFEQNYFDSLIKSYDPGRPDAVTYGSLVFLARLGGYCE